MLNSRYVASSKHEFSQRHSINAYLNTDESLGFQLARPLRIFCLAFDIIEQKAYPLVHFRIFQFKTALHMLAYLPEPFCS